ncbi:MAG: hypothetical protein FWG90_02710 [Oscillospiraceae bacterium]|nr:hypothetical protein [Oscillospiraceae bacterium]
MNVTINDVVDFLGNLYNLTDDINFRYDNYTILENADILTIARRLGKTEERYKNEIKIYDAILAAKSAVTPPQTQNFFTQYNQSFNPFYNPIIAEYNKYQRELKWHTDNIPIYLAIKYGEKGTEWVLNKFSDEVKKWYYATNNQ